MRKIFISLAAILAVGAGGAYLYPSTAILTAIKVRTSLSTTQIAHRGTSPGNKARPYRLARLRRPQYCGDYGRRSRLQRYFDFGGGVAGGRLQTPNIDALAAQARLPSLTRALQLARPPEPC